MKLKTWKKVLTALTTLEKTGVLDKVIEIDVNDTDNITMNYDNRLTVKCGTQLANNTAQGRFRISQK